MESSMSPNSKHSLHMFGALPTTTNHFVTTSSVAIRLGDALRRRLLLHSSFKDQEEPHIPCSDVEITAPRLLFVSEFLPGRQSISLGDVPRWKDVFHERALQFTGFNCYHWSFDVLSATFTSLNFFNGDESGSYSKNLGKPQSRTPRRKDLFDGRQWTNVLLAANVLIYMAQTVSDGNLLYLGAKINSLISEGQLWRLVTSSFLHANIGHLLVNCYSLNSIGPVVENICGPKRYLAIYISSAISSSAMSYWFSKAPAVGASGAIFGLVGSFGMFVLRHRGMVKGTENDLKHIAQIIALNMTIGLLSQGIDNWGHAGGLIGGAAVSWLLGPAWQLQSIARDGRRVFEDKAPIFSLIRRHPK